MDRVLQDWRIRRAEPHVPAGARLLDIGCFDAVLLERVRPRVARAVGIDPLVESRTQDGVELIQGHFPGHDFADGEFDCLTLLAVFEHVEDKEAFCRECARVLAPGGRAIVTVPHPFVDRILDVLMFVGVADGMSTEEHHGFDVSQTPAVFEAAGLKLVHRESFQLGLNRLFVFERA